VKAILRDHDAEIPIISKIERGQAIKNFDRILSVSDGIMVARGDLGVDVPLENVPLLQKEIIHKCNRSGKPVITATQMLESMVKTPFPTRAEVSDVANAILDGTDATMLSAETSIGNYPLQSMKMMVKIAREIERQQPYEGLLQERGSWIEKETDELISYNACLTAQQLGAVAIIAFTQSGSTARRVSKYRPHMPILALTPIPAVMGRLTLHWGVTPYLISEISSVDDLFRQAATIAKRLGLAKTGDLIIITAGVPIGIEGTTNLLKVERV
jgi:pyruvate kinase